MLRLAAMRHRRRGRYGAGAWRKPGGWPARVAVLGLIGLLALLAYFRGWDRRLPPVVTGPASVIDGDSLGIGGWRIRLKGIDAPELEQTCTDAGGAAWACGKAAARELGGLIRGSSVTCNPTEFDQYDRVLAVCSLPNGTEVNAWMVRQGWAVAFGRSRPMALAEAAAKAARRGLWVGSFERPSQWRERHPR
jgi:endonuclease YncB( thermonuclease family)